MRDLRRRLRAWARGLLAVARPAPPYCARVALYTRLHYALIDEPGFWYDKVLRDADAILCGAASDLRRGGAAAAAAGRDRGRA